MKKKMPANQKIDIITSITIVLGIIIVFLIFKMNHWKGFYFSQPILFIGWNIPFIVRRKKQFRLIKELKEVLNISIEEMRKVIGAGKYDLIAWENDKIYLSYKQLYLLEEYLENQYLFKYGKKYQQPNDKHFFHKQKKETNVSKF
jgi:hypothetical protein